MITKSRSTVSDLGHTYSDFMNFRQPTKVTEGVEATLLGALEAKYQSTGTRIPVL